jgi:hypothetical protein
MLRLEPLISEKAARKASDELARVKSEQRAEAKAKMQEKATAEANGVLTDASVTPAVNIQSAVVH